MKSSIPLTLLEIVQPLINERSDIIKSVKNSDAFFDIKDKKESSDFFYQILKQEHSNGHLGYIIEYKPKNKYEPSKFKLWIKLEHIAPSIKDWIAILEGYSNINTVYDDPILKTNQDRFEKEFKILDSDADSASFDLKQQLFLEDYLNNTKGKILELLTKVDESKKIDLEDLHSEAVEIQSNLTLETKQEIIKRLSKFWGKAQKIGLDVIKEIFVDVVSEFAKKLITGSL
ncbi:MAG: outer membrane lipoprotein-sorting protein [Chitinophagaceae bacterium]|nr:outer membrane lipoprotein-sorting protein [Chitinophagaceae bacterium]